MSQRKEPSPTPNISSISVSGPAGLIATVAILAIALIGIPAARWFALGSVVLGLIFALLLRRFR